MKNNRILYSVMGLFWIAFFTWQLWFSSDELHKVYAMIAFAIASQYSIALNNEKN